MSNILSENAVMRPRSLNAALWVVPAQVANIFVRPSPTTFARAVEKARWDTIVTVVTIQTICVALLTLLWGRIALLSNAHSHPLHYATVIIFTLSVPVAFFGLAGLMLLVAKQLGGQGTYLTQCYSALLISLIMCVAWLLFLIIGVYRALPVPVRLFLVLLMLALPLYCSVLQIMGVMAVHRLSWLRAALVVLLQVIALVALIAVVSIMFMNNSEDANKGSGKDQTSDSSDDIAANDETATANSAGFFGGGSGGTFASPIRHNSGNLDLWYSDTYKSAHLHSDNGQHSYSGALPEQETVTPFVEVQCSQCQEREWITKTRDMEGVSCLNDCGALELTGRHYEGTPPHGYIELECPACKSEDWLAPKHEQQEITCPSCATPMRLTGRTW